ncbi:MAG: tetratricopeptide repeat protein [Desulfovibrionaceae bacterium]|nr:tetratricopeptide repeat protein [Desulfovibrionaceae bacterium]
MSATIDQEKREKITGVFSSQDVRRVGTGTTTRKTIQKTFWFCTELDDGQLEVQPLNPNYVPSGPKKTISKEQFFAAFSPEPEMYVSAVYPKMRELNKTIARGDRYRANGEYYSAEMEYGSALKVDEENVRANFGLGITYLERGESGKAENIFERLVRLDAAFEVEHKHLFNEFGIKLRKNKMLDQSITYYERALELSTHDENLFYNLARAYLEDNKVEKSLEFLLKSLDLNPTLEPAVKFLQWLVTKQMVPEAEKPKVAAALRKIKVALAAQAEGGEQQAAEPAPDSPAAPDAVSAAPADPAPDEEHKGP